MGEMTVGWENEAARVLDLTSFVRLERMTKAARGSWW
jgi:hypothetical protein